jgi:hypothetical protein
MKKYLGMDTIKIEEINHQKKQNLEEDKKKKDKER